MKIKLGFKNRLIIIVLSGVVLTAVVVASLFNMSSDLAVADAEKRVRVYLTKEMSQKLIQVNAVYPEGYEKGFEIDIPESECIVFHAGTKAEAGRFYTSGGRVLACVGVSNDLISAKEKTYHCVDEIKCTNLFYRKDIGDKGIKYLKRQSR